jgi:hypothetical protein
VPKRIASKPDPAAAVKLFLISNGTSPMLATAYPSPAPKMPRKGVSVGWKSTQGTKVGLPPVTSPGDLKAVTTVQ